MTTERQTDAGRSPGAAARERSAPCCRARPPAPPSPGPGILVFPHPAPLPSAPLPRRCSPVRDPGWAALPSAVEAPRGPAAAAREENEEEEEGPRPALRTRRTRPRARAPRAVLANGGARPLHNAGVGGQRHPAVTVPEGRGACGAAGSRPGGGEPCGVTPRAARLGGRGCQARLWDPRDPAALAAGRGAPESRAGRGPVLGRPGISQEWQPRPARFPGAQPRLAVPQRPRDAAALLSGRHRFPARPLPAAFLCA